MALNDLTSVALVKQQLRSPNGTMSDVDDDLIALYVTQASDDFERAVNRGWIDNEGIYHPAFTPSYGTMQIDAMYPQIEGKKVYFGQDVLNVVSISNGANGTLTSDQYRLLPVNNSPKYAVELSTPAISWQCGSGGSPQGAIVVTAQFGEYTATNLPANVELAVTKYASWLYMNRDNDGSTFVAANGEAIIPANAPQLVLKVVDQYKRMKTYIGGDS